MSNKIAGIKGFFVKNENLATKQHAHYHQKEIPAEA
jgi:hypothetical protein|tara:strand:- start:324 stop:431 length:108 start_codon:yes stop_codon:yes gene_type:complete